MKPIRSDRSKSTSLTSSWGAVRSAASRRMDAGTILLRAVLRDARILRQAQERAPQNEADRLGRYDSNLGNAVLVCCFRRLNPQLSSPAKAGDPVTTVLRF